MPAVTPASLAPNRARGLGRRMKYSTAVRSRMGKNRSFKCSHTDSLTGEMSAAKGFLPEKSYRK